MSVSRRQSSRITGLPPVISEGSSAAAAAAPSAAPAATEEKRRKKEAGAAKGIATKAANRLAAAMMVAAAAAAAPAAAAAAAPATATGAAERSAAGLAVQLGDMATRDAEAAAMRQELAEARQLVADLMARLSTVPAAAAAAPAAAAAAAPLAAAAQPLTPSSGPRLNKPLQDLYKGESGEALDTWIEATTQLLRFYHDQTPADAVRWLATGLKSPALRWFNQRYPGAPPASAEELYREIRLRFQPIDSVETARRELRGLRQGKSSVDAYASRFLELKGQLPSGEMSHEALTSRPWRTTCCRQSRSRRTSQRRCDSPRALRLAAPERPPAARARRTRSSRTDR
jgi:hypothetical protein